MSKVTVKVPGTTANMGPGFDTLGCALTIYNTFTFEEVGSGIEITGCDEAYAGADNLAYTAYLKVLDIVGLPHPEGIKISIGGDVPISRGLGSSSTLIVAGVSAANAIRKIGLSKMDILKICTEIEGHPDNVAPAIFGGLVASLYRDGEIVSLPYEISPHVTFSALIPNFELSTEKARAILPKMINRLDAVYTLGCLAVLLKGFETCNRDVLRLALSDRLHEPYRGSLISGFDEIRNIARDIGFCGIVISGSGSTLLAVGGDEYKNKILAEKIRNIPGEWMVLPLEVDKTGAVITEE